MKNTNKNITNRLRKHRKIIGLSQKDVAQIINLKGLHQLSKWENGTSFPRLENLLKLSALYRTLVNELYFELFKQIRNELPEKYRKHLAAKEKEK